jgi:hypothetical protein
VINYSIASRPQMIDATSMKAATSLSSGLHSNGASKKIVQLSHHRAQWIVSLATNISHLFYGHLVIEPITILATRPFIRHSRGELRPISKMSGMKINTAELGGEVSFGSLKMNLLVLVVQLIMPRKDIRSRPIPARSNNPDKFADLNYGIWRKLM